MTRDKFERDYLSPFYEWTLYHTILWWIDVSDDIELDEIPRKDCINKVGIDLYDFINNEENYLDFLFQDWDFLNVEKIYEYYDAMKSQFRQTGNHLTGTEKSSIVSASLLA